MYVRWTKAQPLSCTARRSPTPVPISNACTPTLTPVGGCLGGGRPHWSARPRRSPALVPHTRWSYVRTLDKGTAVGVARPVDLQRRYRSPTHVPNSHACGPDMRPDPARSGPRLATAPTPRLDHCANARTGTAEFVAHDRRRRWSAPPEPTHPVGSETAFRHSRNRVNIVA